MPAAPGIFVCDVDGTLLDPAKRITPATRRAVAALVESGVRVMLATGRIPSGLAAICRDLALPGPHVCMHGAFVGYPETGEAVACSALEPDEVRDHLALAAELDVQAIVAHPSGLMATELRPGAERLFAPFSEPLPEIADAETIAASRPMKTYLDSGEERYEEVLRAARGRFGDRFTVTSPDRRSVELLARGVDKVAGVRAAADALGMAARAFAAAGDGPNDIPILRAAVVSAAMGQSPPEVRAAATFVTAANDRDGLAAALEIMFPAVFART